MKRREFFKIGVAAPAVAAGIVQLPTMGGKYAEFARVSCEKGDPGEIAFAKLCADGKVAKAFLDGEEIRDAVTADASEGWIKRPIKSDRGNVAFNRATGEILYEVVRGRVEIVIT